MKENQDTFVRMRKLIARRHINVTRKIKSLSSRIIKVDLREDREEMTKKEGEKAGLCFALKVLDKMCQTEMTLLR